MSLVKVNEFFVKVLDTQKNKSHLYLIQHFPLRETISYFLRSERVFFACTVVQYVIDIHITYGICNLTNVQWVVKSI